MLLSGFFARIRMLREPQDNRCGAEICKRLRELREGVPENDQLVKSTEPVEQPEKLSPPDC